MANTENHLDNGLLSDEEGAIRIGDIYIPPPPLPSLTFDPTGPRLMISNIIIENFKSYGGKVALGPFQKNFSAIVGPNGSGKSNVIDSMLFVFGYRAQKIRSQTVGVLIHSSDTYPNLSSCSVSVHFQKIIDREENDYQLVPNSEFVISRTAYKDNSSFYCLDGRKVPFREVSKQLRSHGIDLDHNRFLILQGEVEQISLMKPKSPNEHDTGMLEFLEDIIGSGRFKEPIELLAKRVEELNEQRTEKLNRVKAVEKEKDELEAPKNEALEFLNIQNQRAVKKHGMIQKFMYDCNIKIHHTQQNKMHIEVEQKDFLKEYNKIEDDIKNAEKEREVVKSHCEKICKEEEAMQAKFKELELQDVQKREDLKHTEAKNKELALVLNKEKSKLEELKHAPSKLEEEIATLENKKTSKLDPKKVEIEEEHQRVMTNLHSETKDLQEQKDKHEAELMKMQKPVNEAKSKMGIAQVKLELYIKNAENEKKRLSEMQSSIEKNLENLKEMNREFHSLELELPKAIDQLQQNVLELENVTREEVEVLEEFQVKRAKLEESRSAMQLSRNRGRLLDALMQQKSSGRISGIIGRLGDLGAIDEKYDIAISTACGALDNIVTDTMTTAEACVAFLKSGNLGQATFICLDKMQTWNDVIRRPFTPPRGVLRLFDLIKVADERLLPAFYFALRDTLVADDIHQATAIGLQGKTRHRVVTLKGELIEPFGTMSGGGNRPVKGRMGNSIFSESCTPRQIEEMEREVGVLHGKAAGLTRKKYELQEAIAEQERKVAYMRHAFQKHKMEVEATTEQQHILKSQLKDQEERVSATTPDEAKVKLLTENFNKTKAEFEKVDSAAAKVKAVVQKLHDEIVAISGGKMKASQKRLQDINKEIDEVVSGINKKKVAIRSAQRNFTKTQERIASIEVEFEENKEKIGWLKDALAKAVPEATAVLDASSKIKDEKSAVEAKREEIREVIQKLNSQKHKLTSAKMDIDHQIEHLAKLIQENQARLNAWKKDLSKLTVNEMEGLETCTLTNLSEEELDNLDLEAYQWNFNLLEEKLRGMKPNLSAVAEYNRKEQLYLQRVEEMDAITRERDAQRSHYDSLRKQRLNDFMGGFQTITYKLKETYQMLTLGGDAELELVNSLDPFSDGIVFSVRPPRKSWKNISNLSGGEKTLSSLALVFALHYYKPTPFYVMDEIDAALDFRNVTIVGHYIKEQTKNAQFIVISLRNNMFELADRLVGVYKTHNTSKSLAFDPRCAVGNVTVAS